VAATVGLQDDLRDQPALSPRFRAGRHRTAGPGQSPELVHDDGCRVNTRPRATTPGRVRRRSYKARRRGRATDEGRRPRVRRGGWKLRESVTYPPALGRTARGATTEIYGAALPGSPTHQLAPTYGQGHYERAMYVHRSTSGSEGAVPVRRSGPALPGPGVPGARQTVPEEPGIRGTGPATHRMIRVARGTS